MYAEIYMYTHTHTYVATMKKEDMTLKKTSIWVGEMKRKVEMI